MHLTINSVESRSKLTPLATNELSEDEVVILQLNKMKNKNMKTINNTPENRSLERAKRGLGQSPSLGLLLQIPGTQVGTLSQERRKPLATAFRSDLVNYNAEIE